MGPPTMTNYDFHDSVNINFAVSETIFALLPPLLPNLSYTASIVCESALKVTFSERDFVPYKFKQCRASLGKGSKGQAGLAQKTFRQS